MTNNYSFSEFVSNVYALFLTKVAFPGARFIRRPIYMRGRKGISYGNGLTTGHGCRFDLVGNTVTLKIGKNCEIGDYVHIVAHDSVVIGDDVLIASKVFISDTNHGVYKGEKQSSPLTPPNSRELTCASVFIGDRVWIGDNVVILPGVSIGNGCIVGANAVVNRDVKENSIVAGCPAKVIKVWNSSELRWENVHEENGN